MSAHHRPHPSSPKPLFQPARSVEALAAHYPALGWRAAQAAACARHRRVRGALGPWQAALLAAARCLLGAATRAGMRRAKRRGLALAGGAPLPSRVDGLLERELFQPGSPRCPALYRAAMQGEQRLEEALLRGAAFPLCRQLEGLFALWDDMHRLACFLALYQGFEQQAARLSAAQPWRRPGLAGRAAALRALLGMGPKRSKLVFFPAAQHAEAT